MSKLFAFILILCVSAFAFAGGDETAPMQEKSFNHKDWTLKNLNDGREVNLRSFASGKKLVMVVYFAAWCPNWHKQAPTVEKLYQKYKDKGFDVIAVSEYASLADARKDVEKNKFTFTVVSESEKIDDRDKTKHYEMRTAAGDTRRWGSPWNVFLETDKIEAKGDTLTKQAFVVNGEIIEAEVEAFIQKKLGQTNTEKVLNKTVAGKNEPCEPTLNLKKP